MSLTKEQIRRRILLAEDFEDMMLFIFGLIIEYVVHDSAIDYKHVRNEVESRYQDIAEKQGVLDEDMLLYTAVFANDFIRTTRKMLEGADRNGVEEVIKEFESNDDDSILQSVLKVAEKDSQLQIQPILNKLWYVSDDRARFIAENESLTVEGYKDYTNAVSKGYSRKQWISILDEKTRETHVEVAGTVIPIEDFFEVGAARLYYPHDTVIGNGAEHPEETINCRCSVNFLR